MLSKKLMSATVILALGLSTSAMARHGHGMAHMAAQYDANGDGKVTVEEIQAARVAEFQANDTNGDAVLSLEELQALMQKKRNEHVATRLAELDTDGDGSLSVTEFQAKAPAERAGNAATLFGLADTNNDNALDATELSVLKSPEGRVWRKFARMDSDGNGVISETEYSNHLSSGRGGRRGHGPRF